MPGKLTQESAVKRIQEIHGDKYDLSEFVYTKSLNEVDIICKKHGKFSIVFKYFTLTNKHGECPHCLSEEFSVSVAEARKTKRNLRDEGTLARKADRKTASGEAILESFKAVYGDRNDYSGVVFHRLDSKVEIRCIKHNQVFLQSPQGHLLTQGCTECSSEKRSNTLSYTQEDFIEKATASHGDTYDYSLSIYKSGVEDVTIICKKHGLFDIPATRHMNGSGCQKCGLESRVAGSTSNKEEFVARAIRLHGERCDYSLVNYVTARIKVKIRCIEHDLIYEQMPDTHLRTERVSRLGSNTGCRKCGSASIAALKSDGIEGFIAKTEAAHPGKYTYEKVEYINARTHVTVTCKEHGDFKTTPWLLWTGGGCQKCLDRLGGGFSRTKGGILYVMTCGDITKVGITNKSPTIRAEKISRSYGGTFKVAKEFNFDCGAACAEAEKSILRVLRKIYENPSTNFDGYTESFLNVDRTWLHQEIGQIVTKVNVLENEMELIYG